MRKRHPSTTQPCGLEVLHSSRYSPAVPYLPAVTIPAIVEVHTMIWYACYCIDNHANRLLDVPSLVQLVHA